MYVLVMILIPNTCDDSDTKYSGTFHMLKMTKNIVRNSLDRQKHEYASVPTKWITLEKKTVCKDS